MARNGNGQIVASIMKSQNLYLSNTRCTHSMRFRTTWHGKIESKDIYNQIDYIAIPIEMRKMITNARSHKGMKYESDHSMVVTTFDFRRFYVKEKVPKQRVEKLDMQILANDENVQEDIKRKSALS